VNYRDHSLGLVNKEDGKAVGGLNDQENPGEVGDQGIPAGALLGDFADNIDNFRVDLVEKNKLEIPPFCPRPKILLFPAGLPEPMIKKRKAVELRYRYILLLGHGDHSAGKYGFYQDGAANPKSPEKIVALNRRGPYKGLAMT